MMKKILLVKIAWMKYYEGRANIDIPMSGAKYILKNKKGGEIFTFKKYQGKAHGYLPFIDNANIGQLGAKKGDESVNGVTVVFCARHPKEGLMRVVGWYKNATVYRSTKFRNGNPYHVIASKTVLIPYTDRALKIPNVFGRSALCYIGKHSAKAKDLRRIEDYIASGGKLEKAIQPKSRKKGAAFQPNTELRQKVEGKAIEIAKQYFRSRYGANSVRSVEKDNVGWDLEIVSDNFKLTVEVKGLSGADVNVQLTPNEFKAFQQKGRHYRLFVVTGALSKRPQYRVFEYQRKGDMWVGNDKSSLKIQKIYAAKLTIS